MALLAHWEGEPVQVWARLWGAPLVEVHDELGSTNDRARVLVREGAAPFTVVLAQAQTRGRGRTGSPWHSPAGAGLWMSALLPMYGRVPAHLPLLVGLAAARAAESVCAGVRVGLKWPNDLEVRGRKAGGVLCEQGHGPVVAGVGLNVSQTAEDFPREVAGRAVSLEMVAGTRISMGALATSLLRELRRLGLETGAAGGDGSLPADLRAELAARDVLRGRRVLSQQAGNGVARGIDGDGALLVEQDGGRRVRVVAGSVRIA